MHRDNLNRALKQNRYKSWELHMKLWGKNCEKQPFCTEQKSPYVSPKCTFVATICSTYCTYEMST